MAVCLLFILCASNCQSQGVYSQENIERASIDDLNQYLKKARDQNRKGYIMLVGGPALSAAGLLLMERNYAQGSYRANGHNGSEGVFLIGTFLFIGGLSSTLVSLPIIVTNSLRTGRIKKVIANRSFAEASLAPRLDYNQNSHNLNTGITLRIRF